MDIYYSVFTRNHLYGKILKFSSIWYGAFFMVHFLWIFNFYISFMFKFQKNKKKSFVVLKYTELAKLMQCFTLVLHKKSWFRIFMLKKQTQTQKYGKRAIHLRWIRFLQLLQPLHMLRIKIRCQRGVFFLIFERNFSEKKMSLESRKFVHEFSLTSMLWRHFFADENINFVENVCVILR